MKTSQKFSSITGPRILFNKRPRNRVLTLKLLIGLGCVIFIFGAGSWMHLRNLGSVHDNADAIYESQMVPSLELANMRGLTHRMRASAYRLFTLNKPAEINEEIDNILAMQRQLEDAWNDFQSLSHPEAVRNAFSSYQDAAKDYYAQRSERVFAHLLAGDKEKAMAAMSALEPRFDVTVEGLNRTIAIHTGIAKKKRDDSGAIYAHSEKYAVGTVLAGALICMLVGLNIARTKNGVDWQQMFFNHHDN